MAIHYKATRPDGTDFRTGTVDYAGALVSGEAVTHPEPSWDDVSGYLSVSTEPAETLIGGQWPCRLFEVEPVGEACKTPDYPHKRAVHGLRVVREIEAWRALGPQGEHVAAFIARIPDAAWGAGTDAAWDTAGRAGTDTTGRAAWNAARHAAWDAAWNAAWNAARSAAVDVAGGAAGRAAEALAVRDLISPEQFRVLTKPWKILTGEEL